MLEKVSLKLVNQTLESFDRIIAEIEAQFIKCQKSNNSYIDDLIEITLDYRKDVINFSRALITIKDSVGMSEFIELTIDAVEIKLKTLDSIIEKYTSECNMIQPYIQDQYIELETKLYS